MRPYDRDVKKSAFNDVTDGGQIRFLVLLFDVIQSITKLDDMSTYQLTVPVFYGLLDRR